MTKITLLTISLLTLLSLSFAQQTPNYLVYSAPLVEIGEMTRGELSLEDGQNFKDGARLDVLKAYLTEGDVVDFVLSSDTFDTYLTVFDANGNLMGSNDDGLENSNSRFVLSVPHSGRYMIIVSGYSEIDLGTYSLSAETLEVRDDSVLTGSSMFSALLDANDENLDGRYFDAFSFELSEAKTVTVSMSSDVIDSYLLLLDDSDGSVLGEHDDDEVSLNASLTLDLEPGNYTIWATTAGSDEFGIYSLQVDGLE